MKRPSLKTAIAWIADNDDTEWVNGEGANGSPSVTAALVADLFGTDEEHVRRAIRNYYSRKLSTRQRYGE